MTPTVTTQRHVETHADHRLPPAPGLSALRDEARRRLAAIEADALPALVQTRACLTRVWYSAAPDAVPLHTGSEEVIRVHPAGADRLGDVLATEEALTREAMALRELVESFDLYDAGGSAMMRMLLGESATDPNAGRRSVERPCRAVPHALTDERAYTVWLLEYLVAVQQELWRSRAHGDPGHLEALQLELGELEARVQRRAATVEAVPGKARRERPARTA